MADKFIWIDFKPNLPTVQKRYKDLGVQIKSFREPLKRAVQQVVIPSIRKNFDSSGRPSWAPYSDVTISFHQALGEAVPNKLLVKSGSLRRTMGYLNIWSITQDNASLQDLPDSVWYGKIHQSGNANTPARPFIMLQPRDEDDIVEVFDKWLEERISRVWAR